MFNLCSINAYAPYLEPTATWSKASVANRGLVADADTVAADQRKTAVQKNAVLEQMLGLIAQYAPSLLRNDILKKSTSLGWIWNRIRQHYGFQQSEVNFLNIYKIKREEGERYETLYQRLVSHIDDNLLTAGSNITHDGVAVAADEELSPTCERLTVYLWLTLIDVRLPAYVGRVFAQELQTKSLKDIQPQMCMSMDSLLAELNTQEELVQANYSKSSSASGNKRWQSFRRKPQQPQQQQRSQQGSSQNNQKQCVLCKTAGRSYQGHDINGCWFISKFDRMEMTRALQLSVHSEEEDDCGDNQCDESDVQLVTVEPEPEPCGSRESSYSETCSLQ